MNEHDPKLSALLKQWRDIEPPASFEADVWRRIRLAEARPPERVSLTELLQRLLWRPALATAAALMVSVLVGTSAGLLTSPKPGATSRSELGFLGDGTLAGGYLKVAAGPAR